MAEKRKKIYADKTIRDLKAIQDMLMAAGDPFLAGVLNRAIGCVVNQPEADRWISVEERLPDLIPLSSGKLLSEAVIVTSSDGKVLLAVWDGTDFRCLTDVFCAEITHWMPLPEKPKRPEPPKEVE